MKFTIDKNILLENLINVTRAISTKNVIPVLNGIKFVLDETGLTLTASDSDLTIKTYIESKKIKKIEKTGKSLVQSKYIVDIIRKMPSNVINIEVIDGVKILISTDNSQYNLNCLELKEYPEVKIEEHKNPYVMPAKTLKEIISQTAFAISTQELRPLLTGINFKITGDILECVATDSYRLAKKTVKLTEVFKDDVNIVIPGRNIIELDKILTNEGDVDLHIFNNKIVFDYNNITFQSNLLNGTYPNTSNLIPTEFSIIANINLKEFGASIDRAALLTQGKDKNLVKMKINDKEMIINSFASEIGKVEEKIYLENSINNNIDISFSSKYMLDALKTINDDEILILLNSEIKPIVIKSVKDESLIQLILPIKTY